MQMRAAEPTGRKDEVLKRRKTTIELVDPLFHLRGRGGRERGREGGTADECFLGKRRNIPQKKAEQKGEEREGESA